MSVGLVILLFLVGMLAGLLCLQAGWWPDRMGAIPHCRRCDYNLTGLAGTICPECGMVLAGNRELGERHRRPVLAAIGLILVGAGIVPVLGQGVEYARDVEWHRYTPTSWLLGDLDAANAATARRAWEELGHRDEGGSLEPATYARMIEMGLQAQASESPSELLFAKIDYLRYCFEKGRLSAAQQETFFRNMIPLVLSVPQRALQGAAIRGRVDLGARRMPRPFEVRVCDARLLNPDSTLRGGGAEGASGHDRPDSILWSCRGILRRFSATSETGQWNAATFTCLQPGKHRIVLEATVEVREWVDSLQKDGQLYFSSPVSLGQEIDVVPMDSLSMAIETDPALAASLAGRIRFEYLTLRGSLNTSTRRVAVPAGEHMLTYWRQNDALPAAVAFEVIARAGDHEYLVDHLSVREGCAQERTRVTARYLGPAVEKVDLILRPSPVLLRELVAAAVEGGNLPARIWQGEIVYKDVPVRVLEEESPDE